MFNVQNPTGKLYIHTYMRNFSQKSNTHLTGNCHTCCAHFPGEKFSRHRHFITSIKTQYLPARIFPSFFIYYFSFKVHRVKKGETGIKKNELSTFISSFVYLFRANFRIRNKHRLPNIIILKRGIRKFSAAFH